jgi:hypothetical protein
MKFSVCHIHLVSSIILFQYQINLRLLIDKEVFTPSDLSFHNELWFSYSHYTLFSDTDKDKCLRKINDSLPRLVSLSERRMF